MNLRGMSLREVGQVTGFSYGYLGRIGRGAQTATREVAERCDKALDADGALIRAWYAGNGLVRPRQLPPAPPRLVGRARELADLDEVITERAPGTPAIVVIDGPAGAGKTALALYWVHRAAERFVDGHLYVDLRGFSATGPATPRDVLESMCIALDAPHLPDGLEQRTALFRSLLRDRRMLILLDNAAGAEQIEPLLPAAKSCAVVVTSRRVLSRCATHYDGRRITLGAIPDTDAVSLVRHSIGPRRVEAEPDAVRNLTHLCGNLPLALAAAADLVAIYPHRDVADLAAELVDVDTRLDLLDTHQRTLRDVLSWSVTALPPHAARTFTLMGLHDTPLISPAAITAMTGGTPSDTRLALRHLALLHLIEMPSAHVISLHELVWAYAQVLTTELDHDDRTAAIERLESWRRQV
jgi:hypothetical protein